MPFFNFRRQDKPAANGAAATANDSADTIRKRAKHRLMGSTVLVLLGILGFPLLFETQPRPIPVDIPIEIPAKNSVKPLPAPVTAKTAPATTVPTEKVLPPAPVVAKVAPNQTTPQTSAPTAPVKTPEPKTAPAAESKPTPKPSAKVEPAAAQKATSAEPKPVPDDAARASALLNGADAVSATPPKSVSAEERFIVQVGAFADASKAREVRAQLAKAGLKTYTHVAETPQGKRIRVRVGPFANRAEADNAAQKIKTLDLPAAILTL